MKRRKELVVVTAVAAVFALGGIEAKGETLMWNANPETDLAGYKVFYGETSSSPTEIDVGLVTSHPFNNLVAGRSYFFYVTAYNTLGLESNPSAQVTYTVPSGGGQSPTIIAIPDRTVAEDSATTTVQVTISDPDTAATSLTLSGASSNGSLISNSALTFGGSGTNRTLSFRPVADQSGTTDITVTVSDGQSSAADTFRVTVTPVNDSPTISNVSDQTITTGGNTGPLAVTIGDKETAATSLTLTAQSSNPTLVPQSGLTLGGSGANRTVTVQPAANQTGQATITLNVTDGGLTASDSFVVTVQQGSPTTNTVIVENFEAPGFENPGWFEVGTPDDDYSSVILQGGDSLRTENGDRAYRDLNGATDVNLYMMYLWRERVTAHTTLELVNASGQRTASVSMNGSQLILSHGAATATANFAYTLNVRYHVWMEFKKGTGSDGALAFYISTSTTKPATPVAQLSTGSGLAAEYIYFGGAASDSPSICFDTIRLEYGSGTSTPPPSAQPPTIAAIADRSINEDSGSVNVAVTISDPDTAAASLVVTANSSNAALIPNSQLSVSGTGTSRTLSFAPSANQSGTSDITVTVSDGSNTASDTFRVTVAAVNDAPAITSIPAQTIPQNGSTGPLSFTVSDIDTATTSVTVTGASSNPTLIPTSGIVLSGSGSTRTVTVTPAANQSGQATVTLTATDGSLSTSTSFTVTVQAGSDPGPVVTLVENFEGPGPEDPDWHIVRDPYLNYSRLTLEGTYSVATEDGDQIYRELDTAANVNLQFMLMWRELSASHTIVDLSDATGDVAAFLWATSGQIHLTHGDVTRSAAFNYAANTRYYFWLDWTDGADGNGTFLVYISTSSTKPTTPLVSINTGNGNPAERLYFGGAAPNSPTLLFDRVRLTHD